MGAFLTAISLCGSAFAEAPKAATSGWSVRSAPAENDVQSGKPLVIEVFVPLCSDKKGGPCGKHPGAGDGNDLDENLYWGAVFGARRFLERRGLGWTRTELTKGEGAELERATYHRTVSGSRWGTSGSVDVYLVLHAIQGDANRDALDHFRDVAANGGTVKFNDGSALREERVHVVGFMGRNPLLVDGRAPTKPDLPEASASAGAIPSFSIGAYSRETLAPWLSTTGSRSLLLARGAMASEAYLLDAIARGVAENDTSWGIQKRETKSYGDFQKLRREVAELHFLPYLPPLITGADKPNS
jgi:hypothetical protein